MVGWVPLNRAWPKLLIYLRFLSGIFISEKIIRAPCTAQLAGHQHLTNVVRQLVLQAFSICRGTFFELSTHQHQINMHSHLLFTQTHGAFGA